jgi:hypothetical protein
MISTALGAIVLIPVLAAGIAGQVSQLREMRVPETGQRPPVLPAVSLATAPKPHQAPVIESPYARLFTASTQIPYAGTVKPANPPKVVCGLTMFQVDPAIDPKIIVPAKPGDPEPKIRRISPSVCRE